MGVFYYNGQWLDDFTGMPAASPVGQPVTNDVGTVLGYYSTPTQNNAPPAVVRAHRRLRGQQSPSTTNAEANPVGSLLSVGPNVVSNYDTAIAALRAAGATEADINEMRSIIGAGSGGPDYDWISLLGTDPAMLNSWKQATPAGRTALYNSIQGAREQAHAQSDASFWSDNLMGTALIGGAALGGMGIESLLGGSPTVTAGATSIPELGLIGNDLGAAAALEGGIGTADLAAMGVNAAGTAGTAGAVGMDAIEALINGAGQGLSGGDLLSFVESAVPGGTQTGLEFLFNNPSQFFTNDLSGIADIINNAGAGTTSAVTGLGDLITKGFGSLGDSQTVLGNSIGAGLSTGLGAFGDALGGALQQNSLASLLSAILPAALGAYASDKQTDAMSELAKRYEGYGAPSRARYEASFAPGFTMANDPGFSDALNLASKSKLHNLSVTGGNPFDNPNALAQHDKDIFSSFAYPALQNYRNTNSSAGGIGGSSAQAANLGQNAIASQGGVYNAIGAGIADVFNPPKTLAQTLADLRKFGVV